MKHRFKDISIRYKILILTGTIELVMLVLLAFYTDIYVRKTVITNARKGFETAAEEISAIAKNYLITKDYTGLKKYFSKFPLPEDVVYVSVMDVRNRLISVALLEDNHLVNKEYLQPLRTYEIKRSILARDKKIGELVVYFSPSHINTILTKGRAIAFVIGGSFFALNIFILWAVVGRLMRPLRELNLMARRATDMDFDVRVDVKSRDEIGSLAEAFNCLMENLRHTLNKLDNYQDQIWHSERLAVIGEYSTCIMHEIKNMLAGVHCAMELINKDNTKDEFILKVCNEVQSGIRGFNERIMCLLRFIRPAADKYEIIDINEVLKDTLVFLTPLSIEEGVKIYADLKDDQLLVYGNKKLLQDAFINIAVNAFRATTTGGKLIICACVDKTTIPHSISIIFEDNGRGMPDDILPRIFYPYFTTKPDGTGLGLYITKKIIDSHGGRITVESKPKSGTRFIITLLQLTNGQDK